jgi:hypothetical protein
VRPEQIGRAFRLNATTRYAKTDHLGQMLLERIGGGSEISTGT